MESGLRIARTAHKASWICSQCRRASTQTPIRYSTRTATQGLAEDLARSRQRRPPPRAGTIDLASRPATLPTMADTDASQPPARKAQMSDIFQARMGPAIELEEEEQAYTGKELEAQMSRMFVHGDVYSPKDLSGVEQMKWSRYQQKPRTKLDMVDKTGVNHIREYKNIAMMQEFVTSNGRIIPGVRTGLRPVHQRKLAKAIRRAEGIGLIPKTYKHPELMKRARN